MGEHQGMTQRREQHRRTEFYPAGTYGQGTERGQGFEDARGRLAYREHTGLDRPVLVVRGVAPGVGQEPTNVLADRLRVWKTAYNTANLPVGMTTPPDAVSKWLVITRAAVFSMTVTSGLIGGLLAVGAERLAQVGGGPIGGPFTVDYGLLVLAVLGLVVAHAAN